MKLGSLFVLCATAALAGVLGYQLRGRNSSGVDSSLSSSIAPFPSIALFPSIPLPSPLPSQPPPGGGNISSSCNVQNIGDGVGITIVCRSGSGASPSGPFVPGNPTSEFRVEATVNDLSSGSDRFTLQVSNQSLDYIVHLYPPDMTLVDNLGNMYSPDVGEMLHEQITEGTRMWKAIPPRTLVKVNYTLDRPIDSNATLVQFTANVFFGQHLSSARRFPAPPGRWKTKL